MTTRQAKLTLLALSLLFGLWACTPLTPPQPTLTPVPPTITITPSPLPPTVTPTVTPLTCLTQPGRVERGVLQTTKPPQEYLIYLPPCYDQKINSSYPVLYLLHGQTYIDDQWIRIGAVNSVNQLILSGESAPFIIVFPDDRYWNLPPGPMFGDRLINSLIPYIDKTYRTLADREHRALGGLSRGGGWTIKLGLQNPGMFGALGLHSPAVEDITALQDWIAAIPSASFPRLWLDVGDQDKELGYVRLLEDLLSQYGVAHEFHVYSGDHTEAYWRQHVDEYIRWYAQGWMPAAQGTPQP